MTERQPANGSNGGGTRPTGVSFSDATSASDVGGALQPYRSGPNANGGNTPAIMEGVLKKRGANLPVMRDRYCVATWEVDPSSRAKFVLLRTYKSQKSYAKSPEKPVSSHALKCFGAWDGKGNFHKYDHAFLMETSESKVFFCTAPTEAEKRRWIDVMKTAAPALNDRSRSNSASEAEEEGDLEEGENTRPQLQRDGSSAQRSIAKRQSSHGRKGEPNGSSLFEDADSDDDDDDVGGLFDDDENGLDSLTDSEQSPDDGLFRSSSGADSALSGSDHGGASKAEPADWGIYGENFDGPTVSKYDVVDRPVLLLDDELLNQPVDKTPLASDSFLFEDAGPSRFGAIVIKKSERDSDDDLADFVDEGLAARLEREKSEKILKKRAQKLESNRDLYAEMAAARLNSMRKDARHPTKKSPRELPFRPSHVGSVSEYNESEDGYSHITDAGYDPNSSEARLFDESEASYPRNGGGEEERRTRRKSNTITAEASHYNGDIEEETHARKKSHAVAAVERDEVDDAEAHYQQQQEIIEVEAEIDPEVRRENRRKKKKEKQQMLEESQRSEASEIVRPSEDTLFPAEMYEDLVSDNSGREEEVEQPIRRRKSKHKKPSYEETSNETAPTDDLLLFESPDSIVNEADREDERYEEERRLEKERRREERRARKERQRREEEEAAAAAAAELARQHRDAMREREEEKARKRERKERRERRERAKLEKEKKQRKSKEAELQAEVERLRLVQLQQQAEDEKKEKKKKRKEKYSTPAERIQRKEREAEAHAEAHAAEMSSALVLVETPPAPTIAPPLAVSTPVQTSILAQDPQQPAPAPVSSPATVAPAVIIAEPSQPPHSVPTPAPISTPGAPSPVYQEPVLQPVLQPIIQPVFEQQQQSQPATTIPAAPQSQPSYPMMPQYIPGYPAPPQSLPMYASSPYGMYQPQYPPQAYYPPQYANMGYGPGVPMQPQYYQQPPVGYMSGPPMMNQQYPTAAYPETPGSTSSAPRSFGAEEETVFIGPQLPSPKAQASATAAPSASIGPPPPPPPSSSNAPRSNSPALPDLPDLPDIADF